MYGKDCKISKNVHLQYIYWVYLVTGQLTDCVQTSQFTDAATNSSCEYVENN